MEAVARFGSIPIVETGMKTAGGIYQRVKKSNGLINWTFEIYENTAFAIIDSFRPAVRIIEGPLHKLDQMMCKSLDLVENRVPLVYLPPQMVRNYSNNINLITNLNLIYIKDVLEYKRICIRSRCEACFKTC